MLKVEDIWPSAWGDVTDHSCFTRFLTETSTVLIVIPSCKTTDLPCCVHTVSSHCRLTLSPSQQAPHTAYLVPHILGRSQRIRKRRKYYLSTSHLISSILEGLKDERDRTTISSTHLDNSDELTRARKCTLGFSLHRRKSHGLLATDAPRYVSTQSLRHHVIIWDVVSLR